MLHSIEYKSSSVSTDTPTFHVFKPVASEAPTEWHGF